MLASGWQVLHGYTTSTPCGKRQLTLTFEAYNGTERIAYSPDTLDMSDVPDSYDSSQGSLAFYAPWGNLFIFYQNFRFSEGPMTLGVIEGNLTLLSEQRKPFTITLEKSND